VKFFEEKKKAKAILGAVGVGTFLWVLILYPGLWWVLVLLVGAALGLGFFLGEGFLRRGLAEIPQPSVPEPPVALIQSAEVVGVELPSAEEGYLFRFSANVRYQGTPTGQHGNPAQVAALALLERARELTRDYRPEEHTIAQYRLAAVLGEPVVDAATGLTVWANNVVLTLVEEDIQRLQRLSSFRKDLRIWEREQEVEQVRRDALGTTLSPPHRPCCGGWPGTARHVLDQRNCGRPPGWWRLSAACRRRSPDVKRQRSPRGGSARTGRTVRTGRMRSPDRSPTSRRARSSTACRKDATCSRTGSRTCSNGRGTKTPRGICGSATFFRNRTGTSRLPRKGTARTPRKR